MHKVIRRESVFMALIVMLASETTAKSRDVQQIGDSSSCGAEALYLLVRMEGRHVNYRQVIDVLGAASDHGYSMQDLKTAATGHGIPLLGVRLREGSKIDRPCIALLMREEHGHFVVVRPIGHTGKLVQILDSNGGPYVVDATKVVDDPSWTGNVLLVDRRFGLLHGMGCGLLIFGVIVTAIAGARKVYQKFQCDQ